ncbi:hypothetical protein OD91_1810 [Lutibacter sp. Hel_I_33_5]|uniref:gliding motility protein RemB n=1 Tax=Lutibacter sp. Hel_I_33_5 TaxID=1566289 RepID=UPI0011A87982|nr:gliding motility protein RemB [Lutibacter sp. Hel_I_33_5]TVZ56524.1 hypothetical protein OD91_1810 [Lutibacter sp. Hel_I_33_5]
MKKLCLFLVLFFTLVSYSQSEKFPVFDACRGSSQTALKNCFLKQTKETFFSEFIVPPILLNENYRGVVNVIFLVNSDGTFNYIYANSPYKELKTELKRTFKRFPEIQPATYNNHNIEMRFALPLVFPYSENSVKVVTEDEVETTTNYQSEKKDIREVVDTSIETDSIFLQVNSQLNIPFVHQKYVDYEFALHKSSGTHTASKPYLYSEISKHFDIAAEKRQFLKPEMNSWWGKKLWNEHLLQIKHQDYWFTIDALLDVQLGKDNSNVAYTFNNTRVFNANGGFGNNFSFSATIYESQGRFAEYVNNYIGNKSGLFKPAFSEGLVPGRGKAKGFKADAFDYPVAEGYLSFTPTKYMNFQFGHGKNFIGDGYRSFLLSDVSAPSLYLKMKVDFWKFQYTNVWLWGRDVRAPAVINNEHARKYIAAHYLSINITDRLNIGLFETAISAGQNGFDAGFLNPIIFYRAVEFNRGEDSGNAMVGLTTKYKLNDNISLYSQLVIDEFSVGNLGNLSDWRNKFALQFGAKYFDAFGVENLFLQGEFNTARPYTFAHRSPVLNYAHYSQPLGHLWGSNFWEVIGIARYKKDRWSGFGKVILGKKGFDLDETVSYGGNIYQSYDNRFSDTNNSLAQGNTAIILHIDTQVNYLLNPANGLSLFSGLSYRKLTSDIALARITPGNNLWFTVGLRAELFNWYFDF